MIRKGRQVMRKDLVRIVEGPAGFLTDMCQRVCGSVPPARRCIVLKEDLLCNGEGSCLRKCGGVGDCVPNCPKRSERAKMGHRCSFKVLLTMHSDLIGVWEVKIVGEHAQPEHLWIPPLKRSRGRKAQLQAKNLRKIQRYKDMFLLPMEQQQQQQQQQQGTIPGTLQGPPPPPLPLPPPHLLPLPSLPPLHHHHHHPLHSQTPDSNLRVFQTKYLEKTQFSLPFTTTTVAHVQKEEEEEEEKQQQQQQKVVVVVEIGDGEVKEERGDDGDYG
ncbi:hypothetical protein Ahia01_001174100, partial [Argonauta hians]